jgi:hypothetical protein
MKHGVAEILRKALRLLSEARAAIAGSLLDSLDQTVADDAESLWEKENLLRLRELDEDKVKLVPWAEARRRIAES